MRSSLSVDDAEVRRIQASVEAALDRHVGSSPAEREVAVAETLRAELVGVAESARGAVLRALATLYPAPGPSGEQTNDELQALREELRALRKTSQAPAVPERPATNVRGDELVEALVGRRRDLEQLVAGGAAERAAPVVKALTDFAIQLCRTYLPAVSDSDRTMTDRIHQAFMAVLTGSKPPSEVEGMLKTVNKVVGVQLRAFPVACRRGALELLKEISPDAIEAEVARTSGKGLGRMFYYKECWELLQKHFQELRDDEDLYSRYFDRAYRAALVQAMQEIERGVE